MGRGSCFGMRMCVCVCVCADAMQVEQWSSLLARLGDAAKQLGDFETWLDVIETDMERLAVSLDRAAEASATKGLLG